MALTPSNPPSRPSRAAVRADAQQEVFLREVDEALREDQMVTAFRRYGKPVGALVAAGLLALGGWLAWDHYQAGNAGEQGEKMTLALDALRAGKDKDAAAALAALEGDDSAYGATARMLQAAIAQKAGKTDEAAKGFAAVAADAKAAQPLRDLAAIREVAAHYDKLPPQQVIDRLKGYAVPGNPWFGSAGEMVAMAYVKQGRADLAGPLFASLAKDKTIPDSVRRRAQQMAGLFGQDVVDDPGKAAAEAVPQGQ